MKEQIKKVVIAALVAAVSIAAQAKLFYWAFKDGTGAETKTISSYNSDYKLYVFVSDVKDDKTLTSSQTDFKYSVQSKETALSTLADIKNSSKTEGSLGALSYVNSTFTDSHLSNAKIYGTYIDSGSFSAFAIALNASSISSAAQYMVLDEYSIISSSGTSSYSAGTYLESNSSVYDVCTVVWSNGNTSWSDIASIPEPTSGLLLVLGAATLALKRRRV